MVDVIRMGSDGSGQRTEMEESSHTKVTSQSQESRDMTRP